MDTFDVKTETAIAILRPVIKNKGEYECYRLIEAFDSYEEAYNNIRRVADTYCDGDMSKVIIVQSD